jgi:hypothetical protein
VHKLNTLWDNFTNSDANSDIKQRLDNIEEALMTLAQAIDERFKEIEDDR